MRILIRYKRIDNWKYLSAKNKINHPFPVVKIWLRSHNSNLVGNVKSVLVRGEDNISFFKSVWSDQRVDSFDLDSVELLARFLDHWLVGSSIHNENQCVVVFNRLDGALSAQWVLDDSVLVPSLFFLDAFSLILGFPVQLEGDWSSESDLGPDSVLSLGVASLLDASSCLLSLNLKIFSSKFSSR